MIRLKCTGNYRNDPKNLAWTKGQEFEVDERLYAYLMTDAPGCFVKAVDAPPADKMVKQAKNK